MSDRPVITRIGDDFQAVIPDLSLRFDFKGLHEERNRTYADLTITCDNEAMINVYGELFWDQGFNLGSVRARSSCAAELQQKWADGAQWPLVLHEVCRLVVRRHQAGEPFVELSGERRQSPRYRLNPLLPDGQITLAFGDGGTGKGYFALAAALSITTGRPILGMAGIQSRGALGYLDWETDAEEIGDRWARVCEGSLVQPPHLAYRRCVAPIGEDIQAIMRWRGEQEIALLIVDSMGLAVGGNPNDSGDTLRAMGALRALKCTILALDHQGKAADTPGQRPGKSMGNSYKFHHARSVWELKQGESHRDGIVELGLFHHKSNNGRRSAPLALRIEFDGDDGPVTFDPKIKASDIEGVKQRVSIGKRLLDALDAGGLLPAELREQLDDVKEDTIQKTLRRLSVRGYVTLTEGRYHHARTVR